MACRLCVKTTFPRRRPFFLENLLVASTFVDVYERQLAVDVYSRRRRLKSMHVDVHIHDDINLFSASTFILTPTSIFHVDVHIRANICFPRRRLYSSRHSFSASTLIFAPTFVFHIDVHIHANFYSPRRRSYSRLHVRMRIK